MNTEYMKGMEKLASIILSIPMDDDAKKDVREAYVRGMRQIGHTHEVNVTLNQIWFHALRSSLPDFQGYSNSSESRS